MDLNVEIVVVSCSRRRRLAIRIFAYLDGEYALYGRDIPLWSGLISPRVSRIKVCLRILYHIFILDEVNLVCLQ